MYEQNGESGALPDPAGGEPWPYWTRPSLNSDLPWYKRWYFFRVIDWDYLARVRDRVRSAWAWTTDPAGEAARQAGPVAGLAVGVVLLAGGVWVAWVLWGRILGRGGPSAVSPARYTGRW